MIDHVWVVVQEPDRSYSTPVDPGRPGSVTIFFNELDALRYANQHRLKTHRMTDGDSVKFG